MAQALDSKVALVTGSGRGIGRAIADTLAQAGATVILNDHPSTAPKFEELAVAGAAHEILYADVADPTQVSDMFAEVQRTHGRLDILVNNAGITRDRTILKMTPDQWRAVIDVNLGGVFWCLQAAARLMVDQQSGSIVNISSVIGQSGGFGQANYAAAKAGVIALTKTAAMELARHHVRVNAVAPGFTDTPMVAEIPADRLEQITARVPLGRLARPEEIANAVLFLASPSAEFITGHVLAVNGGLYM